MILGWMELGEDMPPQQIWLDDEELEAHFDSIKMRREAEHPPGEQVEQVPMTENDDDEIARWRR